MGLRDALRSLRGSGATDTDAELSDAEAPEPTWFQPRYDGFYEAPVDSSSSPDVVRLRFLPGGKVFETYGSGTAAGTDAFPGPEVHNPCQGDYTAAGRFNVQREFERLISYAVLDMLDDGFAARRIDTADRRTLELQFVYRPDSGNGD